MSIHDYPPLVTVKSGYGNGPLALYVSDDNSSVHLDLGDEIVTTSNTDLAPLAKAILNAVEPEALAIDQRTDLPAERTPLDPGPSSRAVTVEVTPVLPKDATEQIETAVRAAIAEALRKLADEQLRAFVTEPYVALRDERTGANRYYVEQINGIWGVRDREVPGEWAAFDEVDSSDADETATSLNAGEARSEWDWSKPGEY